VPSLSDPAVRDFLGHGTRTGKLGFLAAGGRPLVAPVWFIVEDGSLVFNTRYPASSWSGCGRSRSSPPPISPADPVLCS